MEAHQNLIQVGYSKKVTKNCPIFLHFAAGLLVMGQNIAAKINTNCQILIPGSLNFKIWP
jgi:hypothetical protein